MLKTVFQINKFTLSTNISQFRPVCVSIQGKYHNINVKLRNFPAIKAVRQHALTRLIYAYSVLLVRPTMTNLVKYCLKIENLLQFHTTLIIYHHQKKDSKHFGELKQEIGIVGFQKDFGNSMHLQKYESKLALLWLSTRVPLLMRF